MTSDVTWPITNTLVHTKGVKTEVAIHRLGADSAALILRFGGASDVTIHVQHMEEIITIRDNLNAAIFSQAKRDTG